MPKCYLYKNVFFVLQDTLLSVCMPHPTKLQKSAEAQKRQDHENSQHIFFISPFFIHMLQMKKFKKKFFDKHKLLITTAH